MSHSCCSGQRPGALLLYTGGTAPVHRGDCAVLLCIHVAIIGELLAPTV